jgi:histone H3
MAVNEYNNTLSDKVLTTFQKKKKSRFFETYISKVLKQISDKNGITSNAKQQLNSAICILARSISFTASRLTEISKKRTASDKEVENAVRVLFSGDLSDNSVIEGIKSVQKFNIESSKGTSRQGKAGIVFPPSITEKFLRNFGYSRIMITKSAPIFLASVLEYVVAEVLLIASKHSNINKRVRITIRDIYISVKEDQELSKLFNTLNISFIGGGSIPYIHSSLIVKKQRKKKPTTIYDIHEKKPHRFRPGTVAIREIKRFQKMSNCLTFAKYPFERLVRHTVSKKNGGMKISKDVFIILQYFIEQYIVDILKDSNSAAIHAGRVKLMLSDIEFISSIRGISTKGGSDINFKKNIIETEPNFIYDEVGITELDKSSPDKSSPDKSSSDKSSPDKSSPDKSSSDKSSPDKSSSGDDLSDDELIDE